ncbi:MAG: FAD:protein FMN transferase, partial [Rikenellaceae bacterium]|nr:FAD:protein FMN transferase [Rikenellaceae bacterium]
MSSKITGIMVVVGVLLALTGCKTGFRPTTVDGFTQGTTFHIVVRDDIPKGVDLKRDIDSVFLAIEKSMSLFDDQSLLSRINRNETDSLDRYIMDCIRVAEQVSRQTDGLFDVTIGPITRAYGFGGGTPVSQPDLDSLLQWVGYDKIRMENNRLIKAHPRVQIDLNGIAQGYTVDVLAQHFDGLGLENYIIEMGGEIFSRGLNARNQPWVVGIDRPDENNQVQGSDIQVKIPLSGRGLATSGNYRKFYEDESGRKIVHTVDPLTGQPVINQV